MRKKQKIKRIITEEKISKNEPKHTLYINNLSDHIGSNRLRTNLYLLFSIYGEVINISINTKKQRGQAFITMRTIDESNLAMISLNNEQFFGKPLQIQFSKNDTTEL